MSKKEILVSLLVLVILIGGALGGFLVWNHYDNWKKSAQGITAAQTTVPPSSDIALQQSQASNSGGLSVDTSASGNPAQLGSGQSRTTATSGTSSSSSANGSPLDPSTFAQYDKYKTADSALFGDIQVGDGQEVKANTKVGVSYKGWLTNGTLFDQSATDESGKLQPLVFTVGSHQVIPGFEQDMIGMKVGGTRLFIIPPKAGYGDTAQKGIPAGSVLIFQVKLLDAL